MNFSAALSLASYGSFFFTSAILRLSHRMYERPHLHQVRLEESNLGILAFGGGIF